jgi:hypothetical protein
MKVCGRRIGLEPLRKPSITELLTSFDPQDVRMRKFWLLALSAIVASFVWLLSFCCAARLLPLASWPQGGFPYVDKSSIRNSSALDISTNASKGHSNTRSLPYILPYINVSLGFLAGSTLDAIAVVANFNRPLTQQFHYVMSLHMAVLGILVSASLYLWNITYTRGIWAVPAIISIVGITYMVFILATD